MTIILAVEILSFYGPEPLGRPISLISTDTLIQVQKRQLKG